MLLYIIAVRWLAGGLQVARAQKTKKPKKTQKTQRNRDQKTRFKAITGGGLGKPSLKDRYLDYGSNLGLSSPRRRAGGGGPPAERSQIAGYLEQLVEIDKTDNGRQRTTHAAIDGYILQGGADDGRADGGEAYWVWRQSRGDRAAQTPTDRPADAGRG